MSTPEEEPEIRLPFGATWTQLYLVLLIMHFLMIMFCVLVSNNFSY